MKFHIKPVAEFHTSIIEPKAFPRISRKYWQCRSITLDIEMLKITSFSFKSACYVLYLPFSVFFMTFPSSLIFFSVLCRKQQKEFRRCSFWDLFSLKLTGISLKKCYQILKAIYCKHCGDFWALAVFLLKVLVHANWLVF